MKKIYLLLSLLVISLLALSLVTAFWPFTGKATDASANCLETDNGYDINTRGTTTAKTLFGKSERTDSCSGDTLKEYYCLDGKIKSKKVVCIAGCSDGACVSVVPSCTDSDSGVDEDVAGTVTDSSGAHRDACSGNTLTEYYCQDNNAVNQTIVCSYQCKNGACKIKPFNCTDTDNGINASQAGVAKAEFGDGVDVKWDICSGNTIKEAYCGDKGASIATVKCRGVCKNQSVTFVGNIAPGPTEAAYCDPLALTCTDSDNGQSTGVNGTVTSTNAAGKTIVNKDKCLSKNSVREYYCTAENTSASIALNCTESDICIQGKCTAPQVLPVVCTDSDGGKNFTVKGTITTTHANVSDFCLGPNKLAEFYCKNPYKAVISLTTRMCKEKCSDGTCIGASEAVSGENINP